MSKIKIISGIEVDATDDHKASVHLAHKLGERVFRQQMTALEAEKCLAEHYGDDTKFKQSREILSTVSAGQSLPVFLIINRPGWNMLKAYWQEHPVFASCLAACSMYLLFTSF